MSEIASTDAALPPGPLPSPRGRASLTEVPPGIVAVASAANAVEDEGDASSSISALRFKLKDTLADAVATGRLDGLVESAMASEDDGIVRRLFPDAAPTWDEAFEDGAEGEVFRPTKSLGASGNVDSWDEAFRLPDDEAAGNQTTDRSIDELRSCLNVRLCDAIADGSLDNVVAGALARQDSLEIVAQASVDRQATLEDVEREPSIESLVLLDEEAPETKVIDKAPSQEVLESIAYVLMKAIQARDARIGELQFCLTETERLLAERDVQQRYLEGALCDTQQDIAHLDVDLEAQRRALQRVNNHFDEMYETVMRRRAPEPTDKTTPEVADNSRSEVSTTASGTTLKSSDPASSSRDRTLTLS